MSSGRNRPPLFRYLRFWCFIPKTSSQVHLCPAAPEHASGDRVLNDTPYSFRALSSKPLYSKQPSDYGGQRFFHNAKLILYEIVHGERYLDRRNVLDRASNGFNW